MIKKTKGEKLEMTNNVFSKIGFDYLTMAIVAIICQIIIVNIIHLTNPIVLQDINIITAITSVCNYLLPFPIFYWLMKKIEVQNMEKQTLSIKTFILYAGIALSLMWVGNTVGLFITDLLSGAIHNNIANPVQNLINNTNIWFNLIIISIIAPIFEELFFRKILIDRTIKYGANVSIVLSAVLFALFHGNLNQFCYALLLGGFLAYVYTQTGNIKYSIILHGIVNFMGSVVSLFVGQSAMHLQTGGTLLDASLIMGYLLIIFITLIIGFYGIAKFRPKKTELPLKTIFLNYGMVCFIGFFIFEILRQILA